MNTVYGVYPLIFHGYRQRRECVNVCTSHLTPPHILIDASLFNLVAMPACETKFIKNQSGVLYKTSVLDQFHDFTDYKVMLDMAAILKNS